MSVEQIAPLISQALSANKSEQDAAQEQLNVFKPHPDYATSLLSILLRQVNSQFLYFFIFLISSREIYLKQLKIVPSQDISFILDNFRTPLYQCVRWQVYYSNSLQIVHGRTVPTRLQKRSSRIIFFLVWVIVLVKSG